jgi:hypothetical protein
MVREREVLARSERATANVEQLRSVSWRRRAIQVVLPIGCIVGYLLWTGSGVHQDAIRQLIVPVSAKGWLLILPYALLVPLLLVRDRVQLFFLERRARLDAAAHE